MLNIIKASLIVLELSRILLVLLYLKYPQAMRAAMVTDAIIRVLYSLLPMELISKQRALFIDILVDCFTNYCGDFWLNLFVINLQNTAIVIFSGCVQKLAPIAAINCWALQFLIVNAFYVGVAAYMGRFMLILGNLQYLTNYHFKFAYNLKEGIVTMHGEGDSRKLSYINKSALRMLVDEQIKDTEEQKNADYSLLYDKSLPMFKRVDFA